MYERVWWTCTYKSKCVDMLLRYSNYKKTKFCYSPASILYMYMSV